MKTFQIFFNLSGHIVEFAKNLRVSVNLRLNIFYSIDALVKGLHLRIEIFILLLQKFYGCICLSLLCIEVRNNRIESGLNLVKGFVKFVGFLVCKFVDSLQRVILFAKHTEVQRHSQRNDSRKENCDYDFHFCSPPIFLYISV